MTWNLLGVFEHRRYRCETFKSVVHAAEPKAGLASQLSRGEGRAHVLRRELPGVHCAAVEGEPCSTDVLRLEGA